MTGLVLASLLGAISFLAAGFFYARMTTPPPPPAPLPIPPAPAPPPAPPPAPAREVDEGAYHREIAGLKEELRMQTIARGEADKRAIELGNRLVSSGQQVNSLRTKLAIAEKGGAITPVRQTAPPSRLPERARASVPPPTARMQALAPGLFAEIEELRRELSRLEAENRRLRGDSDES